MQKGRKGYVIGRSGGTWTAKYDGRVLGGFTKLMDAIEYIESCREYDAGLEDQLVEGAFLIGERLADLAVLGG